MTAYMYILVCMYGYAWVYTHTYECWTFRHDMYFHINIYLSAHVYIHNTHISTYVDTRVLLVYINIQICR